MELIGSCETMGYTVEAYFPEPGMEDIWTIWVVKDGRVVHETTVRIEGGSAYGVDDSALAQLESAAEAALASVVQGAPSSQQARQRPACKSAA